MVAKELGTPVKDTSHFTDASCTDEQAQFSVEFTSLKDFHCSCSYDFIRYSESSAVFDVVPLNI